MDTLEKYLWYIETKQDAEAHQLFQSLSTEKRGILLRWFLYLHKKSAHYGINPYTLLILFRSLKVVGLTEKVNRAILLEFCKRYDANQHDAAYKVLELGTGLMLSELNSFLNQCDCDFNNLTGRMALYNI